jgi:hypothetical protein
VDPDHVATGEVLSFEFGDPHGQGGDLAQRGIETVAATDDPPRNAHPEPLRDRVEQRLEVSGIHQLDVVGEEVVPRIGRETGPALPDHGGAEAEVLREGLG